MTRVTLLGGAAHGRTADADAGITGRIAWPVFPEITFGPGAEVLDPLGGFTWREEMYDRVRVGLPVAERAGWTKVEMPWTLHADLHPELRPEWVMRYVWRTADHEPVLKAAFARMDGTVGAAAQGFRGPEWARVVGEMKRYEGFDSWAIYRIQKRWPGMTLIDEWGIQWIEEELDRLDRVLDGTAP